MLSVSGASAINDFAIRTDDPAFISAGEELVAPSLSMEKDVPPLDSGSVQPILDEAIRRFTETFALSSEQQATLAAVDISIANLPGLVLARNNGNQIELDANAAGHGWFVDLTSGDDSEFDANGQALAGSDAEGDIDLLTALTHELGHVLGFDHGSLPIMDASLTTGLRLELSADSSTADATSTPTLSITSVTAVDPGTYSVRSRNSFTDGLFFEFLAGSWFDAQQPGTTDIFWML